MRPMRNILLSANVTLVIAATGFATQAFADTAYLKIEGIPGEAKDAGHQDWITVQAWSLDENTGNSANSSNRAAAKVSGSLTVTKTLDKSSAALSAAAQRGRHFTTALLENSCVNGKSVAMSLQDVLISSLNVNGAGRQPTENITFKFARVNSTEKNCALELRPGVPTLERAVPSR
jgi:type VI secretion system secreted protein Hcp